MDGLAGDNLVRVCMRPMRYDERVIHPTYSTEEGSQDEGDDGRREMVESVYFSSISIYPQTVCAVTNAIGIDMTRGGQLSRS
jgi:hypothetical protein